MERSSLATSHREVLRLCGLRIAWRKETLPSSFLFSCLITEPETWWIHRVCFLLTQSMCMRGVCAVCQARTLGTVSSILELCVYMCVCVCVCMWCMLIECVLSSVCAAGMEVLCALHVCNMAEVGGPCELYIWRVCFV